MKFGVGVAGDTKFFIRYKEKIYYMTVKEIEELTRRPKHENASVTRVFEMLVNGEFIRVRIAPYMADKVLLHKTSSGLEIKTGALQPFSTELGDVKPTEFGLCLKLRLNHKPLKYMLEKENSALYTYTAGKILGAYVNSGVRGYHPYNGYYVSIVIDKDISYRYITNIHSAFANLGVKFNKKRIERREISETHEMIIVWSDIYYQFISQFIDETYDNKGSLQEDGFNLNILLGGQRFVVGFLDGFFLKDHLLNRYTYIPDDDEFEILKAIANQVREDLVMKEDEQGNKYIQRDRQREPYTDWVESVEQSPEMLYQIQCAASEGSYFQTADGFMLNGSISKNT